MVFRNSEQKEDRGGASGRGRAKSGSQDKSAEVRKVGLLSSSQRKSLAYLGCISLSSLLSLATFAFVSFTVGISLNMSAAPADHADMTIGAFVLRFETGAKVKFLAGSQRLRSPSLNGNGDWAATDGRNGERSSEPQVFELGVHVVLVQKKISGLREFDMDRFVVFDNPRIFSFLQDPKQSIDMSLVSRELTKLVRPDV